MAVDLPKEINIDTEYSVCPQCDEFISEARVLPCLHSFCLPCLDQHVQMNGSKKVLSCPTCGMEVARPKGGLAQLPKNVFLMGLRGVFEPERAKRDGVECDNCNYEGEVDSADMRCLDCEEYLCKNCKGFHCRTKPTRQHMMASLEDIADKKHQGDIRDRQKIFCDAHPEEPVNMYCSTCDKVICMSCTSEQHEEHNYMPCHKARKEYAPALKASLHDAQKRSPKLKELISEVDRSDTVQSTNCDEAVDEIKKREEAVHELVKKFAEGLIDEVKKAQDKNSENLGKAKQKLESLHNAIEHSGKFTENLLTYGKSDEVMYLGHSCDSRLRSLKAVALPPCPMVTKYSFKSAAASEKMMQQVFGKVGKTSTAEPSALRDAAKDRGVSSNSKSAFESNGSSSTKVIKAKLIEEFSTGGVTLAMASFWSGDIAVAVQGDMKAINYESGVDYFIRIYGEGGHVKSQFRTRNSIMSLAVMNDNIIVAVDAVEGEMLFYMIDGRIEHSFRVSDPGAIAINSSCEIIMAGNNGIYVYDEHGEQIRTIEDKLIGAPASHLGRYVCVNEHKDIFVTDPLEHCIRAYGSDGSHILSYGTQGNKSGQFNGPSGIVADSDGHLIVADIGNSRIRFLNLDEDMKSSVITRDKGLEYPKFLALPNRGQVAVGEQYGGIVRIFEYL